MARLLLSRVVKLASIAGLVTLLLSLYTLHPSSTKLRSAVAGIFSTKHASHCPPDLWASGQWTRRDPPRSTKQQVTSVEDILEMEGFAGCASDRHYRWHIGSEEDQWHRYPDVAAFEWTPPEGCNVRQFRPEEVIRDMVEKGGWLLLGGEQVFCGLSFSSSLRNARRRYASALTAEWRKGDTNLCQWLMPPTPASLTAHHTVAALFLQAFTLIRFRCGSHKGQGGL